MKTEKIKQKKNHTFHELSVSELLMVHGGDGTGNGNEVDPPPPTPPPPDPPTGG